MNDLLTLEEAAPLAGVTAGTLRQMCKTGQVKHVRIGPKKWLYRTTKQWIAEYHESCVVEAGESRVQPKRKKRERRTMASTAPSQTSLTERMKALRKKMEGKER